MARAPCYGLPSTHIPRVPSGKENGLRKSAWDILLWQLGFLARQLFSLKPGSFGFSMIINAVLGVFSPDTWKTLVAFLVLLFLPVASALDNEVTQSRPHGSASRATAWISLHSLVRILVGCLIALIVVIGGHLGGVVRILIGPLMGFTSVLWMTMRNDSAVRPEFSWIVFGAWSVLTLTYLCMHSFRVAYEKLYLLVTLAFAGLCICVLAFVQRSPTQGGLVTIVPLCVSFSAYAVAFFFPSRRSSQRRRVNHVEDGDQ